MAELVDALDLKSRGPKGPCGFESRWGHTEDEKIDTRIRLVLGPSKA